ncbi:MAG: DMT family transporter [Anaerolineae bacterium]
MRECDVVQEGAQSSGRGHSLPTSGVYSGLLASFLLGWAPILGKFAYKANVDPMTLASLRTLVAAVFLWGMYLLVWRRRIIVHWRHLVGCFVVGAINGFGSLFYYTGLDRLDASRAALLGAMYPVWVVVFLSASGQAIRTMTLVQLIASMLGAVFITNPWRMNSATDFLGAMLMIASAAVNGWYIVMGQWVLADVPARSGTLYIMTGMAVTVVVARLLGGGMILGGIPWAGWEAIAALGLTTALSRMAMFFSLEKLGGVQTAILSLVELAISLTLAFVFLGDRLAWFQWLGALLLLGGGILARHAVEHQAEVVVAFDPIEADRRR